MNNPLSTQAVHYGEEGSPVTSVRKRSSRLSMRKGRSIVHKNLEDNYGAVITANHEAIAQILEQVSSTSWKFYIYIGQRYNQKDLISENNFVLPQIYSLLASNLFISVAGVSEPPNPSEPTKPCRCHESATCRFLRPQRVRGVAH